MKDDVSPICRSQLVNTETGNVIFKKLNFIYVSLPKFEKDVSECKTLTDRWLYTLIHSQPQYEIDEAFLREDELFSDLLDMIMLDKLTPTEMEEYKTSKLDYEALAPYMSGHYYLGERNGIKIGKKKGILLGMRQGIQQGVQQGIQQGVQSTALNALKNGISIDIVSKITNLPVAEIEQLQKQLLIVNC
jgi:predicted transposase/invertase (TIGR01784 family)